MRESPTDGGAGSLDAAVSPTDRPGGRTTRSWSPLCDAATRMRSGRWSTEHGPFLMRLALMHVPSRAIAEEVVQDTWLAVLNGIDRFEGRSSLRTWIASILLNKARTRGQRERRVLPFSFLQRRRAEGRDEPRGRLGPLPGAARCASRPLGPPAGRVELPEEHLRRRKRAGSLLEAIAALPPASAR